MICLIGETTNIPLPQPHASEKEFTLTTDAPEKTFGGTLTEYRYRYPMFSRICQKLYKSIAALKKRGLAVVSAMIRQREFFTRLVVHSGENCSLQVGIFALSEQSTSISLAFLFRLARRMIMFQNL